MESDILLSISRSYSEVLPPNKEALLLIVWLTQKIKKGEIEEEFTTRDFEEAVEDIADFLQLDKNLQKETLAKKNKQLFLRNNSKG